MKFKALFLQTPDLKKQVAFYTDILGFNGKQNSLRAFEIQIHDARLVFGNGSAQPPYHFALHIPAGIETQAADWLDSKTEVLEYDGEKIQQFPAWNAKSLYFKDPSSNIVEFISRPGIADNMVGFGPGAVAGLAEIGLAVDDLEGICEVLHSKLGLGKYDKGNDNFCAVGNDDALFICVREKQKTWFPTSVQAERADFAIQTDQGAVIFYRQGKLLTYPTLDEALTAAESEKDNIQAQWMGRAIGNLCGPRDGRYLDRVHSLLGQISTNQEAHGDALSHRRYNYKSALLKGDRERLARTQRLLADTYRWLGRNSEAHSNYDEAISRLRDLGSPAQDMAVALRGLALVHDARGAEEKARSAWNRALHFFREAGDDEKVEEAERMLREHQEG